MAESQKEVTFPVTNYTVGDDGILCETLYSYTLSTRLIIPKKQVQELLQAWVSNQRQIANSLQSSIEGLTDN